MPSGEKMKHIKTFEYQQYVINNAWCTSLKAMAAYLEIDARTIKKYYAEEIEKSNAEIVSLASESAKDLLIERNYAMTRDILAKKGTLADDININHTGSIELNSYVDKPKDLTLDAWLEHYGSKMLEQKQAKTIEHEELIQDAE